MKLTSETHDDEAEYEDNNVLISVTGSTVVRTIAEQTGVTEEVNDETELE